ncbi:MAG: hypothetical protein HKN99_00205 [Winogradskyella sp.]|nr:hypothetical protein [Winogradskyella sp.]
MKKLVYFGLVLLLIACKNEKKKSENQEPQIEAKEDVRKIEVLDTLSVPQFQYWSHNNVVTTDQGNGIVKFNRTDASVAGYSSINNIGVFAGSKYRVTAMVKKGAKGNQFGLRLSSVYPNRADAVFDLTNGTVVGTYSNGDFENESANIELVGEDWYKCSISAEVFSNKIFVFLGSTNESKRVSHWEGKGGEKYESDIYINKDNILIEEIGL